MRKLSQATSAAFAGELLKAAANYTEKTSVNLAALNAKQKIVRQAAGQERMRANNQRMKDQAAADRQNDNQTEMF